jgi:hypothetical protein
MRSLLGVIIVIFFIGCTHDVVSPEEPLPPSVKPPFYNYPDSAIVKLNDINVLKYIVCSFLRDTLSMQLNSTSYNGAFYYPLEMAKIPALTGQFIIHKVPNYDFLATALYLKTCCYNFPDQIDSEYVVNEPDSLQNFIQMNVDTATRKFSAKFNVVFVNEASPYDTLHIRCDTLFSRW